jgi:uncharacterized protein YlzI (FlbEa/FlbD family)
MMEGLPAIPDRLLSLSAGHLLVVDDREDRVREKSKVGGLVVGLLFIKAS